MVEVVDIRCISSEVISRENNYKDDNRRRDGMRGEAGEVILGL